MSPRFVAASRDTLGDFVVRSIQEAVLAGELKPGDRVVEADLAQQMGISRAPVREGIRELVAQGLLVTSPRHGTFVRSWSVRDFIEVFVIRGDLEDLALRLAAAAATAADLARLDGLLASMRTAVQSGQTLEIVRHDMALHRAILTIAGSEQLQRAWSSMTTVALKILGDPHPEAKGLVEMHQVLVDRLREHHGSSQAMIWFRQEGARRLLAVLGLTVEGLATEVGPALAREFVRVGRLDQPAATPPDQQPTNGRAGELQASG